LLTAYVHLQCCTANQDFVNRNRMVSFSRYAAPDILPKLFKRVTPISLPVRPVRVASWHSQCTAIDYCLLHGICARRLLRHSVNMDPVSLSTARRDFIACTPCVASALRFKALSHGRRLLQPHLAPHGITDDRDRGRGTLKSTRSQISTFFFLRSKSVVSKSDEQCYGKRCSRLYSMQSLTRGL